MLLSYIFIEFQVDVAESIAINSKSPDLRAPLAIPDSPFSSTVGDSSILSSAFANQRFSLGEIEIKVYAILNSWWTYHVFHSTNFL